MQLKIILVYGNLGKISMRRVNYRNIDNPWFLNIFKLLICKGPTAIGLHLDAVQSCDKKCHIILLKTNYRWDKVGDIEASLW